MYRDFGGPHEQGMTISLAAPPPSLSVEAGFGFLARYVPDSLSPLEWDLWQEPVLALVAAAGPANKVVATIWAGLLCETIALVGPEPGTDLGFMLGDPTIDRVAHERRRRGKSESFAAAARDGLNRLQAIARGFTPVTSARSSTPSGWAPRSDGIDALQRLARGDSTPASQAQVLLEALVEIPSGEWVNPLPDKDFQRFKCQAAKAGELVRLSWPELRSERVRREFLVARPTIELFRLRPYAPSHWDRLSKAIGSDVPGVGVLSRGSATLVQPHSWIIRDVTVNQLRTAQPATPRKTASKAEARRLARTAATALSVEPEPLAEALEDILASWWPRDIPAADWQAGRDLTHEAMRRSHIRGEASFKKHLRVTARHVCWAVRNGYPQRIEAIFTGTAIDDGLTATGGDAPTSTRGTVRSDLRRIAAVVNPEHGGPVPAMTLGHNDVKPPYTEQDIYWILRRIPHVTHPPLRRAISTAVALGLGAGLNAGDLRDLTRAHIDDRGEDGILLTVPGRRPRLVWVRRDYEDLLREGIRTLTRNEPVLGRRQHKDTVRDLYEAIQPTGKGARVLQGRLRNNWIATLMCEPIPVAVLLQVAGLEGARTLTDIAAYIHPATDTDAVRGAA